jgi:hypothetical protein
MKLFNRLFLLTLFTAILVITSVQAWSESNFATGGGVRIGWSSSTCIAGLAGALRYNSASGGSIDFCHGGTWLNSGGSGAFGIDSLTDAIANYTNSNVFLGEFAGVNTTTGTQNTALGHQAFRTNVAKGGSLAIGYQSQRYATSAAGVNSTRNTGIGWNTMIGSSTPTNNTGVDNVAVGNNAFGNEWDITASRITAIGGNTMWGGNEATDTVGIGVQAVWIGGQIESVGIGRSAFNQRNSGAYNTGIGQSAFGNSGFGGSASYNVAIGTFAGMVNQNGNNNVMIGYEAMDASTNNNNIAIGYRAGRNITTGSNNITIGANINAVSATGNNQLNIGNVIRGNVVDGYIGIGISAPTVALDVNGDINYTGTVYGISDHRVKAEIEALGNDTLDKIMRIKLYRFAMKDDPAARVEFGVMADEIEPIFPDLVTTTNTPEQYKSVNYTGLIAPSIKAIQQQQDHINANKAALDRAMALARAKGLVE